MATPNTKNFKRIRQAIVNAVNYYDDVTKALIYNFMLQNDIQISSPELDTHIEQLKKDKLIQAVQRFKGETMIWYLEPVNPEPIVPVEMFIVNKLQDKPLRKSQIIALVILNYGTSFMSKDKINKLVDRLVEIRSISSYTPIDRKQPVYTPVLDDVDVGDIMEVEYGDEEN